ncbi:putative NAD(P)-binding protein [Seiridium cardinale]
MPDQLEDVRPMFDLRSRNYILAGGAQGIGSAVTRAICERGDNVAVMHVQTKPVGGFQSLTERDVVRTAYIQTDVTKQDDLDADFAKALEVLGSIGRWLYSYGRNSNR